MQLRMLELSKLAWMLVGRRLPKQGALKSLSSGKFNLCFLGKNEMYRWKFSRGKKFVWHKNPELGNSVLKMNAWEVENCWKQSTKRTRRYAYRVTAAFTVIFPTNPLSETGSYGSVTPLVPQLGGDLTVQPKRPEAPDFWWPAEWGAVLCFPAFFSQVREGFASCPAS